VSSTDELLYLDNAAVLEALDRIDVLDPVRRALRCHGRGEISLPPEAAIRWTTESGDAARSLVLPAAVGAGPLDLGVKIINANPANPSRGLPRASGLILLFDPATARIRCAMQAEHVSSGRTAAVSALAVETFAAEATSLAVIGAGALAKAHLRLVPAAMPSIREVRVFDTERARADRLADAARSDLDDSVTVAVSATAREAVEGAGVVIPVTTVTEPYIAHEWLAPDSLVVNVSLDDCAADVYERAVMVVVDDWQLVSTDSHRLLGRMAAAGRIVGPHDEPGPTTVRRVDGELSTYLLEPRPRPQGVIVVNPFGMGTSDVALATAILAFAEEHALGRRLPV
jgi:ornithine cyclodeaminase